MIDKSDKSLSELVEILLDDAGFTEEMYIFIDRKDEVFVDFDDKKSADYLRKIANEPEWTDFFVTAYILAGKRHRVSFILW
jgi:hypothetical protein